jgi:hypothetical protein
VKAAIGALYEEAGLVSGTAENGTATWVFPTKSTLDKKKLLAQGVTLAQIEAATITAPGKPYLLITPKKGPSHE